MHLQNALQFAVRSKFETKTKAHLNPSLKRSTENPWRDCAASMTSSTGTRPRFRWTAKLSGISHQNMPSLGQILAKGEQRVTLRWFWGEQWGRVMAPYKAADAMTHSSSGETQLVKPAPSHGRGAITINLSNMAQTVVITWKRLVRGGFQLVESNNSNNWNIFELTLVSGRFICNIIPRCVKYKTENPSGVYLKVEPWSRDSFKSFQFNTRFIAWWQFNLVAIQLGGISTWWQFNLVAM